MNDSLPVIELRSAAFGYHGKAVITDVSFAIHPGEVVAVVGPNGSGKSTLMRGILGLNDHISGDVSLFGTPEESFTQRTLIGYVPQRHTLSSSVRATVSEIVEVGRLPHRRWFQRATATDSHLVHHALDQVGLAERATDDVSALSGGQHRRVLIARALAAQPEVLVMDEPTAGVDVASQEVLAGVLAALAERGVTLVIVTHEIEALAHLVTRIIEVSHGHIAFDGSPTAYAGRFAGRLTHTHPDHHSEPEPRPSLSAGPMDAATHPGSHHA